MGDNFDRRPPARQDGHAGFLSKRLAATAAMVTSGSRVADIGTDHAYLPIWLVKEGICPLAIAADLRQGPLLAAYEHVHKAGLDNRVALRLSDGLQKIAPGEVDTVTITGMGGPLICKILSDGENTVRTVKELILSPQSDVPEVRRYLLEHGIAIIDEVMVCEDGKYYVIIKAAPIAASPKPKDSDVGTADSSTAADIAMWSEEELVFGRFLLRKRPQIFLDYLDWRIGKLKDVCAALSKETTERAKLRLSEMEAELDQMKRIRHTGK